MNGKWDGYSEKAKSDHSSFSPKSTPKKTQWKKKKMMKQMAYLMAYSVSVRSGKAHLLLGVQRAFRANVGNGLQPLTDYI